MIVAEVYYMSGKKKKEPKPKRLLKSFFKKYMPNNRIELLTFALT